MTTPEQKTTVVHAPTGAKHTTVVVTGQPGPNPNNPGDKVFDQAINQIFRTSSKVLLNCRDAGVLNPYLEGARKVIRNMYDLWKKKQLCDVTLECRDGVLYAHKLVMAAYSDTLCARFSEYPLSQAITISLREFGSNTVQALLEFMYTTELHLTVLIVGEMLALATELGIDHVKCACMAFLGNITIANCFTFLEISIKHNLKDLTDRVERFMIEHFTEIIQTDGFLTLSADRLVRFLTEHTRRGNFPELDLFRAIVRWIEYRRSERLSLAPMLMRCIKMHMIAPRDLVNVVEKVDFMTGMPECFHMLYSAMTFHALNQGAVGSALATAAVTGGAGGTTVIYK